MAHAEYGRLFTEADVKLLLTYAATRASEEGLDAVGVDADGNRIDPAAKLLADFDAAMADAAATNEGLGFQPVVRLTFPADEPLFLIRAQDKAALAGLYGYDEGLFTLGVDPKGPHRRAVSAVIGEFRAWQDKHPTKVPD